MTGPVQPTDPTAPTPPSPHPRPPAARLVARPEPRFGVSLAGVGVGIAVIGVIVWGGDFLVSGIGSGSPSDSRRLLGVFLSLAVVAVGYALAVTTRRGPLVTAGVVASALGVPVLMGFLTFSTDGGSPISFDAVALVSIAVWLVSYGWVPGTRGHAFYLGLASTLLWVYILDKSDTHLFSPVGLLASFVPFGIDDGQGVDWGSVSLISFVFGVGYYALMWWLDHTNRAGAGTPFAVSGFVATVVGIATAASDLHTKGTAALLIAFGVALGVVGARSVRRFTTWAWTAAAGAGIVVLIADSLQHNKAGAGITLIAVGVVLVLLSPVVRTALNERPDEVRGWPGEVH